MAQKIPILIFLEKQNGVSLSPYNLSLLMKKLICNGCKHKKKKGYVCVMNNLNFLDLKKNTCAKFTEK